VRSPQVFSDASGAAPWWLAGAPVAIAPIGADYLVGQGLPAEQILSVPGLGQGDVLNAPDFTVTALHAYHLDFGLTADQVQKWQAVRAAQAAFDVSTETIKERVHDEFPASVTVQPALVEPVTISRSDGAVAVGEVHVR
jgi:hypothetical protein